MYAGFSPSLRRLLANVWHLVRIPVCDLRFLTRPLPQPQQRLIGLLLAGLVDANYLGHRIDSSEMLPVLTRCLT